jgi:hypothetical protein
LKDRQGKRTSEGKQNGKEGKMNGRKEENRYEENRCEENGHA